MKKLPIILFGGNTKQQDGPLLTAAQLARKKNCKVTIITDKTHLNLPTKDGSTLQEKLKSSGFEWHCFKKLEMAKLKKIHTYDSIGFSLNSPWIFKKNMINFFNGKLYNYHDAPLPKSRGAATYTWAILLRERRWGLTIHKISESIDVGNIVKQKLFNFPVTCKIPIDYLNYKSKFEKKFFAQFLDDLISNTHFKTIKQKQSSSTYWPRLVTPINGFINWNWNADDIELFIRAFDDPHQGASTFLDGKKIRLKKCMKNKGGLKCHPFQSGLIYKIENGKIFVATSNSSIIIAEVYNLKNKKINSAIKVGHRFYTPTKFLDHALSTRANYKIIESTEAKTMSLKKT